MRWIALASLALSLLICAGMSWIGFTSVHIETCGPNPPVAFRMTFAVAGVIAELVCNIGALVALSRNTENGNIAAAFLPWCAMGLGFGAFLIPVFSAGLC